MAVRKRVLRSGEVRWLVDYTDQAGKRRAKQFTKKRDADTFEAKAKNQIADGIRHAGRFIAYYRVSTVKQGASGLGLEAQGKAVADHLAATRGTLLAEFTEIESGKRTDRPELDKALSACRLHGATLLVAKLDRLARNAHFLLGLKEAGIEFVCCDMPSANRLTVGIMAMVAEEEARLISVRTKAALAAAKARGVKLGRARNATPEGQARGLAAGKLARAEDAKHRALDRLPFIREAQKAGITSLHGIAKALTASGVPTPWGSALWHARQVKRVLMMASPRMEQYGQ